MTVDHLELIVSKIDNSPSRFTRAVRRQALLALLRLVEAKRRRLATLPMPLERGCALEREHRIEVLCIRSARLSYLADQLQDGVATPSQPRHIAGTNSP